MTIQRARIPIPIRALQFVNSYIFSESATIVDPGMYWAESAYMLFKTLNSIGIKPCNIENTIVTHFHVDHSTLTPILAEVSNPVFMIGERDKHVLENLDKYVMDAIELFVYNGMPNQDIEAIKTHHPALRLLKAYEKASNLEWKTLANGDRLNLEGTEWEVIHAPGHTPGHILLYSRDTGAMITGDTLLPRITPHVTLHGLDTNPLGDYIESLKNIARLKPTIAYPGHGDPIDDPAGRAVEILEHHVSRLKRVARIIASGPISGYLVAKTLKWHTRAPSWDAMAPQEKFFAMGEALSHLRMLEAIGIAEKIDIGGVLAWRLTVDIDTAFDTIVDALSL